MVAYLRFFGIVLLMFSPLAGFSQQSAFNLTLSAAGSGTNETGAVCENAAGNYVVAGYAFFGQQADITIAEINAQGAIVQQNLIGNSSTELPYSITQADAGYYIMTGSVFDNFNDYDWFVAKLDASLQPVWMKRMGAVSGNDYANSVYEVSPDHFVITGTVGLSGSAKPSVVMIDSSGTVLHQGYMNTNQFASPNYRGRYLGNGEVAFSNLANAISVLDTTGAVVKQGAYNFATFTRDVQPAANGGYAMCGVAGYGSLQGAAVAFAITDSTLNTTPVLKRFNMSGFDMRAVAMERDLAGNYVVAANALGLASGNANPLLLWIDPSGNLLDARSYLLSGFSNLSITAMIHTSDDGFVIVGGDGFSTAFVTKIDSSGYCPFTTVNLASNTLSSLSSTPHSPVAGTISVINPQLSSTATGQINETVLCVLTGVHEYSSDLNLQLYPSVTNGELNIVLENAAARSFTMEVISASGQVMMRRNIGEINTVDVSGLAQGIYLVRITDLDSTNAYTARFAKVTQ